MSKKITIDIESKTIILGEGFTISELTNVLADIANYKIKKVEDKTESFGEVKYPFNQKDFYPTCIPPGVKNPFITTLDPLHKNPVKNPYAGELYEPDNTTKILDKRTTWTGGPNLNNGKENI